MDELRAEVDLLSMRLGVGHPRTLSAQVALGNAQRLSGDLDTALKTLAEAFEQAERLADAQQLIASGRELGLTLLASSRLSEAAAMLDRVQRMTAECYGADSPEWAAAAEELALALRARGDLGGALRLQREAFETSRKALGDKSLLTLVSQLSLTSILTVSGMPGAVTVPLLDILHERLRKQKRNRLAPVLLTELGTTHYERGEFEASLETLREASGASPEMVPFTARIDAALARTLSASPDPEQWNEGFFFASRALDERSSILGKEHPQTLYSMLLLSHAAAPRDVHYAVEVGREAARASEAVLGRGHVDTLGAYEDLASLLARRGDEKEAGDLRRENFRLRAADDGILGDAQPPIENLAGTLTEPLAAIERVLPARGIVVEGGGVGVVGVDEVRGSGTYTGSPIGPPDEDFSPGPSPASGELVKRTARVELDPAREIVPGERFDVVVQVDCGPAEGPGAGELILRPGPDVEVLTLSAWLVVSRHFEIEGEAVRPLELDLREAASPRLTFGVRAIHPPDAFDEDPEVRVLFSYRDWPSGQVSLLVPLTQPTTEPAS